MKIVKKKEKIDIVGQKIIFLNNFCYQIFQNRDNNFVPTHDAYFAQTRALSLAVACETCVPRTTVKQNDQLNKMIYFIPILHDKTVLKQM